MPIKALSWLHDKRDLWYSFLNRVRWTHAYIYFSNNGERIIAEKFVFELTITNILRWWTNATPLLPCVDAGLIAASPGYLSFLVHIWPWYVLSLVQTRRVQQSRSHLGWKFSLLRVKQGQSFLSVGWTSRIICLCRAHWRAPCSEEVSLF